MLTKSDHGQVATLQPFWWKVGYDNEMRLWTSRSVAAVLAPKLVVITIWDCERVTVLQPFGAKVGYDKKWDHRFS